MVQVIQDKVDSIKIFQEELKKDFAEFEEKVKTKLDSVVKTSDSQKYLLNQALDQYTSCFGDRRIKKVRLFGLVLDD